MEVLQYKCFNPPSKGFNSYLGVRLIAYFEGNDSWGQDGDRITFVQFLKDTFYWEKEGVRHYTWKLNKDAVFTEDISQEEERELDWTIDQICRRCGNTDFGYTEKRMEEMVPMSSQEGQTQRLMEMPDEELRQYGFFMLAGKDAGQRKEYIDAHMFSPEETLPDVVFSAEKKGGKWERARMADTPCTVCDERMAHGGGQRFQVAVLHESSGGQKEIIGTLSWGWDYKKKVRGSEVKHVAELLELKFEPCAAPEMTGPICAWNGKSGYMKIEGLLNA